MAMIPHHFVLWSMHAAVATFPFLHSHPNVMLEAYRSDGWSVLFFIIFLVITLYLFTNVVCTRPSAESVQELLLAKMLH